MTKYGYARVSSQHQDTSGQEEQLRSAGCVVVCSEKRTGTTTQGRTELEKLLEFIQPGDCLMVTRIDRLARSVSDLEKIVGRLKEKGATLRAIEQPIDTSSAAGMAFLQMLGIFAEFENALRRDRQLEGIAKAKAKGAYRGRPPSIDEMKVRALKAEGLGATAIAKKLGIGRASVYRVLAGPIHGAA